MQFLQRLALVLLCLLVLAGAVHGPLHGPGQDCGLLALCNGAIVLMRAPAAMVLFILALVSICLRASWNSSPPVAFVGVWRGRAPPVK